MAEFMAIEVAENIERGLDSVANRPKSGFRVRENPFAFLDLLGHTYHAGALGLAFIGKAGDPRVALDGWMQVSNVSPAGKFAAAAGLLGISVGLARLVELNHRNGVPAAEIAGSLRIGALGLSFRNRPHKQKCSRLWRPFQTADSRKAFTVRESMHEYTAAKLESDCGAADDRDALILEGQTAFDAAEVVSMAHARAPSRRITRTENWLLYWLESGSLGSPKE